MKKYARAHEEYAVTPLTISPNHNAWASRLLVRLLDGRRVGARTFCSHWQKGLAFFMDRAAWDEGSDYLLRKIERQPAFVRRVAQKSEAIARNLLRLIRAAESADLAAWSNRRLSGFLRESYQQAVEFCAYGYVPVLSDHYFQKYSHLLKRIVKQAIERSGKARAVPETVSLLSTPLKPIPSRQARIELLRLVLRRSSQAVVDRYYQKWFWTSFGHLGPRVDKEEVRRAVQSLARRKRRVRSELDELETFSSATGKQQVDLMRQLGFNPKERYLFAVARLFTYLKGLRMETLFGVYAQWARVLAEMSSRSNVAKDILYYCPISELCTWLERGRAVPVRTLESRKKFCVWIAEAEERQSILIGQEAKRFLKRHGEIERTVSRDVLVIHGTVASPGHAEGTVRIVNRTSEIGKVKRGDILVSVATNPSLIPAMEKAAAFVTDAGGLTSHAAIVAREMKKPCVIGTKIGTKVLKDGDRVVVDAKSGDVKKV